MGLVVIVRKEYVGEFLLFALLLLLLFIFQFLFVVFSVRSSEGNTWMDMAVFTENLDLDG